MFNHNHLNTINTKGSKTMMTEQEMISTIEQTIGYTFQNKQLLLQAFTRSSYRHEHAETYDNEILEFYGDAALSLAVNAILFSRYTEMKSNGLASSKAEGKLSALRSALTNKQYLAEQIRQLNLQQYLRLGNGDQLLNIQNTQSVMEDLFESLIGAICLDCQNDLYTVRRVVNTLLHVEKYLNNEAETVQISHKNTLQEHCQKAGFALPAYRVTDELSEDLFTVTCTVAELGICETACGHNKKEAENKAAKLALERFRLMYKPSPVAVSDSKDAITQLKEYCEKNSLPQPVYKDINDITLPDNSHVFTVKCTFDGKETVGVGRNKKEAQKNAAQKILEMIRSGK